jgi:hypothetical protein
MIDFLVAAVAMGGGGVRILAQAITSWICVVVITLIACARLE